MGWRGFGQTHSHPPSSGTTSRFIYSTIMVPLRSTPNRAGASVAARFRRIARGEFPRELVQGVTWNNEAV
jgi:hypothetical protein